jgi:hypothetical protein
LFKSIIAATGISNQKFKKQLKDTEKGATVVERAGKSQSKIKKTIEDIIACKHHLLLSRVAHVPS